MSNDTNTQPFYKFVGFPIFVGVQAAILLMLAPFIPFTPAAIGKGLLTWAVFQAWAMYFLAGSTLNMALKTLAGYTGGIIASVVLIKLGGLFSKLDGSTVAWGTVIAVFFVAFCIICAERVRSINFLPSYFIGSGAYFAIISYVQRPDSMGEFSWFFQIAMSLLISVLCGLFFGWITVCFRTWYNSRTED